MNIPTNFIQINDTSLVSTISRAIFSDKNFLKQGLNDPELLNNVNFDDLSSMALYADFSAVKQCIRRRNAQLHTTTAIQLLLVRGAHNALIKSLIKISDKEITLIRKNLTIFNTRKNLYLSDTDVLKIYSIHKEITKEISKIYGLDYWICMATHPELINYSLASLYVLLVENKDE